MWFYLGIFTTVIAFIIRFHQQCSIKSALQERPNRLIPVHGKYTFDWTAETEKFPATGHLEIPCVTALQCSARVEPGQHL